MKKISLFFLLAIVAVCVVCGPVVAGETKMLPTGAKVSATVGGNSATVTISGIDPEMVEYYNHGKVVYLGAVKSFTINLDEGYRFNFKFGGGKYVLLTPEMKDYPPAFFGPGVALDCSNPQGCCFKITP